MIGVSSPKQFTLGSSSRREREKNNNKKKQKNNKVDTNVYSNEEL